MQGIVLVTVNQQDLREIRCLVKHCPYLRCCATELAASRCVRSAERKSGGPRGFKTNQQRNNCQFPSNIQLANMSLQQDPETAPIAPPSHPETAQEPRSNLPPDLAELTDEQISILTQEITDSYTKDVPLVGPFLPISVLLEEFKDNEPFKRKISGLAEKWSGFRRTARNGNCFYQAFMFAWLDHLQRLGDKRILHEIHKVQKTAKTLDEAGIYRF